MKAVRSIPEEKRAALLAHGRRLKESIFRFDYPARVRLAVFLLVFLSLTSHLGLLGIWKDFDPNGIGRDGITVYEQRFAGLKGMFTSTGVVGYISDAEPYNIEFYLAQYALAPVTIDPNHQHQLVVANFFNKAADQGNFAGGNLVLLGDFGKGVKLFRLDSK